MITKDPTDTEAYTRRWWFTNSARTAFEVFLRGNTWKEGTSLLMPAYIGYTEREGSGVFDPVRNTGTPFTFYPLGERLQIDLDVIGKLLATGKHPMLLCIHYFGLPHVDMDALKVLCQEHGTLLIEDCAHVPGPVGVPGGLGSYGDAAIYSLHKVLPVLDGGVLRLNAPGLKDPAINDQERCGAGVLEHVLRANLDAVMRVRRRNYQWLAQRLRNVDGVEVLYPEIGPYVPHDLPLRIQDGLREKLYFALMEDGLPTIALYYRMIDQISIDGHPHSHALAKSILNLPVHQDIREDDLHVLCDAMELELTRLRSV